MSPLKHMALCAVIPLCAMLTVCSADTPQTRYGTDSYYFMALRSLQEGETAAASRYFLKSVKKSSPLIARRSMEELAALGGVQERISLREEAHKRFNDEKSLLDLCAELNSSREYAKIIRFTSDTDLSSCDNRLAFYRIHALYKKGDSKFQELFYRWCMSRPFTSEHYRMYSELAETHELIHFRAAVFQQKYSAVFPMVKKIVEEDFNLIEPQIVSDMGKTYLYGSPRHLENAMYFDSLTNALSGSARFYSAFYAGRMYDRTDAYRSRALSRFLSAMQYAVQDSHYDNALWYYLNTALKVSNEEALAALETYARTWHDAYYFDDFLDTLSVRLLTQREWLSFYRVTAAIDGNASPESCAKFSYVSARLADCSFLKPRNVEPKQLSRQLYLRALNSGADFYYRMLACSQLNLSRNEIEDALYKFGNLRTDFVPDTDAERLLLGYAEFGLAEYIYDEWRIYANRISFECALKLSSFLRKCAGSSNNYYAQSLRIASRKANAPEHTLTEEMLRLFFPQNFSQDVSRSCGMFGQPEYLLYSLIRTESFFDPSITSHAGAIGLTQLMESTAKDVARKLKAEDYSLTDASTNIQFGSYYLEEMRRRLDGSDILALFAYNGGITRVRSWVKLADSQFGTKGLPHDLLLEVLPFSETRDYGRKTLSAAVMYAYLYYGKSVPDTVKEILD